MAKKKRKDEKEEEPKYDFVPPDFDEKGFLEKDIKGTKTLAISTVVAIIAGVVAFATTGISIFLGIALIIACIIALRWIYPLFKIDPASVEKKTMAGNYVLLFLLALGIWIILLNSPFSDNQDPQIMDHYVMFEHNGVWKEYVNTGTTPISDGDLTNITVLARDNGRIASVQVEVHASGQSPGAFVDMQPTSTYGKYEHTSTYSAIGGTVTQYLYTIKVTDGVGRTTTVSGSFSIVP